MPTTHFQFNEEFRMKRRITLAIVVFVSSSPLFAATMMEVTNGDNGGSRVWIDDNYAHLDVIQNAQQSHEEEQGPGEMIVDLKHQKLYAIDHQSKSLVDLSENPGMPGQPHNTPPPVKLAFESQGRGPDVAGYATQQYNVTANGASCYKVLYSKAVLKNKHIVAFYEAMIKSSPAEENYTTPCEAADAQIEKVPADKYGIALKVMDNTGKMTFEVKKIQEGATPPKNYLKMPAGYKTKSITEMMQQQMHGQTPPPPK
jgi:hypothetical protein